MKKILTGLMLALVLLLAPPARASELHYCDFDGLGLVRDSQAQRLEEKAREISEEYGCGVYIMVLEDYTDYGGQIEDVADKLFRLQDLGYGSDRSGILLLLSMADRDYALQKNGSIPKNYITDYGHSTLKDAFLDDFDDDRWYDGFSDYLDRCEELLAAGARGEPIDRPLGERLFKAYGIGFLISAIIALVTCTAFKAQMKTARKADSAEAYVTPGGVELRVREDRYTHTTRTRRKIETGSSGGRSGGGRSSSGKF